jgi:hypothetical protein
MIQIRIWGTGSAAFHFPRKILDGFRLISVVLTGGFDLRNRDSYKLSCVPGSVFLLFPVYRQLRQRYLRVELPEILI